MNNGFERGVLVQGRTLDRADIVVIGNGIAGLTSALEARRLAPGKRIVMITDQVHPTINTPALKQFMVGKLSREQLLAYPAGTERAERIHVVTARVEEIHAQSKYVTLTGGRNFGYSSLLIATGSAPSGLPESLPGRDFDGVRTLHRLQDYLDLRRRLGEVYEAVVIGSGAHAIETVMGLVHYGVHVHWMIRSETILSRMLDDIASSMVMDRIRRAGVSVYTNTEVLGIVGRIGCVAGVITNTQQMIPCQLVIACTGTQAVSTLAQRCTLPMECGNGIRVDDQLRTSVPDVFAAGDVAALRDPLTGKYEPRALWYAAVTQGRRVASAMVGVESGDGGKQAGTQQGFGVQWHATHLGDLSMLTVGKPLLTSDNAKQIATLTDTSGNGYRRVVLLGDRLIGYLSLGQSQPDSLAVKRIIDEGLPVANFTKALLKGTFDARSLLSQQQSHAVKNLLTTRRLPTLSVSPPLALPTPTQAPITTGSLPAMPLREHTAAATSGINASGNNPFMAPNDETSHHNTDPLAPAASAVPQPQQSDTLNRRETGPLQHFEEEELTSFTGKLANQSGVGRVIDSTLIPVIPVQAHRTQTGKLWAYMPEEQAAQRPMHEQKPQSGQKPQDSAGKKGKTGGLWAYSDYEDKRGR